MMHSYVGFCILPADCKQSSCDFPARRLDIPSSVVLKEHNNCRVGLCGRQHLRKLEPDFEIGEILERLDCEALIFQCPFILRD